MSTKNEDLFTRAQKTIPGGVNSPVRAFRSVGGTPRFFARGEGAYVWDADGKRYIDYVGSWGPLILGHADSDTVAAVQQAAAKGLSFCAPTEGEIKSFEALAGQFQTADGRSAFAGMMRPAIGFRGPRAHRLPDGLLLSNPRVVSADHIVGPGGLKLTNTEPEARNGIHNGQGFLFARFGEGSGRSLNRVEIDNRDFAPSMCGLFGLPNVEYFEGSTFLS